MVRTEIIQKRISKANEYINYLEKIRKENTREEFKREPMVFGSSERFLHLVIESLLDIGNQIISDQNLGEVEVYKDIPEMLYQNDYISKEQKEVFTKITSFRNILVHDYFKSIC